MDYKLLGKRIREERIKLNLTQEQLAEYVDISTSYMGQIERGERSVTLDSLLRISNRLSVSVDYLLRELTDIDETNIVGQFKQLIYGKSLNHKQMAIDVIRVMFSHLEDE